VDNIIATLGPRVERKLRNNGIKYASPVTPITRAGKEVDLFYISSTQLEKGSWLQCNGVTAIQFPALKRPRL
jgi:hypothetical protein